MKSFRMIFPLFLFLAACDRDDEFRPELSNNYLPLAIGNYWEFKSTGEAGQLIERRKVEAYVTLNNHEYHMMVTTHLSEAWSGSIRDTAYYRIDDNGFVFVYRKSTGIEENRYRLNANDGDTWSFPYVDNYVAEITLSERSKKIGRVELQSCKDYSFDVRQWADEEYTYTLAPGVGFVKEFSDAWGAGVVLTRARIDGQLIKF